MLGAIIGAAASLLGGAKLHAIIYSYKTGQELSAAEAPAGGKGDLEKSIELPLIMDETDISQKYAITWEDRHPANTAQGESFPILGFKGFKHEAQSLELKVMVDATGVHETKVKGISYMPPDISEYIKGLRKVLYCYQPSGHQPNYLMLVWGKIFGSESSSSTATHGAYKCVLEELEINYKLFSSTGKPVRAEVKITLKPYVVPALRPTGQSPDLTHLIEIKMGDNLPKLCKKIYEDERYYHDIVRINNLSSAYAIKPGMQLLFPPLDKVER